jgi:hypothetical protein
VFVPSFYVVMQGIAERWTGRAAPRPDSAAPRSSA